MESVAAEDVVFVDQCYRCGYDLRGIADEQPCPECGLLAERSRRPSEALRDARPRWLLTLSAGVWLILVGLAMASAWFFLAGFVQSWVYEHYLAYQTIMYSYKLIQTALSSGGFVIATLVLGIGVFLLTRPEGYAPADHADRQRRRWI